MLIFPQAHAPASPEPSCAILLATPVQHDHARRIARARAAGHDHCRKAHEVSGTAREMARKEAYGALAEIVLLDALFRQGLTPEDYTLAANRVPVGPDFCLQGVRYQVKSVLPGNKYLCINEEQRTDPRHASDYILPIVFTTPNAMRVLRPIPTEQVGKWTLRKGHSPYRSVDVSTLPVLCNLHDLISK